MDPNPVRSGMDIIWSVSQTRIVKHKIAMITYRQEIAGKKNTPDIFDNFFRTRPMTINLLIKKTCCFASGFWWQDF